jgi:hypothetical protein
MSPQPTVRALFRDISPLIEAVPVAGPPAVLLAIPWLLLVLVLAGPFALLFTFVLVLLAAALVIAAIVAIAASPYLLVRHLRAVRARHATSRAAAPERAPSTMTISAPGY